jgi:hypothetical protein
MRDNLHIHTLIPPRTTRASALATKNRFTNRTPLRFGWYFNNNDARFIASRIRERDAKIAVRFNFESNDAASKRVPIILVSGAF